MRLHHLQGRARKGYTTFGCVWEKGEAKSVEFRLQNNEGNELPIQSRVMAWWPDKSIKWSAHTADASLLSDEVELIYVGSNQRGESTAYRLFCRGKRAE